MAKFLVPQDTFFFNDLLLGDSERICHCCPHKEDFEHLISTELTTDQLIINFKLYFISLGRNMFMKIKLILLTKLILLSKIILFSK